jgi:hypothetical protein
MLCPLHQKQGDFRENDSDTDGDKEIFREGPEFQVQFAEDPAAEAKLADQEQKKRQQH